MSRLSKAATAASIVAQGPAGVRRVLASVAVIVLLGGLALAALLGFAAWGASHPAVVGPLPCPPAAVAVDFSTRDVPSDARQAVTKALSDSGRVTTQDGWDAAATRDLVIAWSPGSQTRVSTSSSPTTLTLGSVPSAAEVRDALGARLAACDAAPGSIASTPPAASQAPDQGTQGGFSWPRERGWSLTGVLGLGLGLWWLAGPNAARALWRALWPVRLGWRAVQRWRYRRSLRQGVWPSDWPEKIAPGQRWHEDDAAMHDRTTFRRQIAESEPARRQALRAAIRAERLDGTGIGPARLWRRIYRAPTPKGAPESEGVSS